MTARGLVVRGVVPCVLCLGRITGNRRCCVPVSCVLSATAIGLLRWRSQHKDESRVPLTSKCRRWRHPPCGVSTFVVSVSMPLDVKPVDVCVALLTVNCWPEDVGGGMINVNMEYSLQSSSRPIELNNVVISIPLYVHTRDVAVCTAGAL